MNSSSKEYDIITSVFVSLFWSGTIEFCNDLCSLWLTDSSECIFILTFSEVFLEGILYAESVCIVSMTEPKKFVTGTYKQVEAQFFFFFFLRLLQSIKNSPKKDLSTLQSWEKWSQIKKYSPQKGSSGMLSIMQIGIYPFARIRHYMNLALADHSVKEQLYYWHFANTRNTL